MRATLPLRRASETLDMGFRDAASGALKAKVTVTLGYYDDGRIGEVFLDGPRLGSELEAAARDIAVLASLALQYGVTPTVMRRALTEDGEGRPLGLAGQLAELLVRESS